MSTRATYLFKAHNWTPEVCFYIHSDGYASGAAQYFYNAAHYYNFTAEGFIRGNVRAEFVGCHDTESDTEHHYTITGNNLVVMSREIIGGKRTWKKSFNGTVCDFINKNINKERFSEGLPFSPIIEHNGELMTERRLAIQSAA